MGSQRVGYGLSDFHFHFSLYSNTYDKHIFYLGSQPEDWTQDPALQADSLPSELPGKPKLYRKKSNNDCLGLDKIVAVFNTICVNPGCHRKMFAYSNHLQHHLEKTQQQMAVLIPNHSFQIGQRFLERNTTGPDIRKSLHRHEQKGSKESIFYPKVGKEGKVQ